MTIRRLGIFGGTFNPIHLGHLLLAERAREQYQLDQVWFIPTAIPPHKSSRDLVSGRERLTLLRLAIRGNPAFRASDLELQLGGVSYSIRTLEHLHRRYPRAKLFLLVGSDMLTVSWHRLDDIARLCTFLVAKRPASRPRASIRKDQAHRVVSAVPRTFIRAKPIDMPQLDLSSSAIRARVHRGTSIRYLVPEAVERYLATHRLYRGSRR